jgi:hypothetical protein
MVPLKLRTVRTILKRSTSRAAVGGWGERERERESERDRVRRGMCVYSFCNNLAKLPAFLLSRLLSLSLSHHGGCGALDTPAHHTPVSERERERKERDRSCVAFLLATLDAK